MSRRRAARRRRSARHRTPDRAVDRMPAEARPVAEAVVPITHVPDDPGPDPFQEPEPVPEQTSGAGLEAAVLVLIGPGGAL